MPFCCEAPEKPVKPGCLPLLVLLVLSMLSFSGFAFSPAAPEGGRFSGSSNGGAAYFSGQANLAGISISTDPPGKTIYLVGVNPPQDIKLSITVRRAPGSDVVAVQISLMRERVGSAGTDTVLPLTSLPPSGEAWQNNAFTLTGKYPTGVLEKGAYTYTARITEVWGGSDALADPVMQDNAASVSVSLREPERNVVPELPAPFIVLVALVALVILNAGAGKLN